EVSEDSHPFHKILLNQQILKVLLHIVITNKPLMDTLLLGQQEIIQTIRQLTPAAEEGQEAVGRLERKCAERVEGRCSAAVQQVVEQYTRLPAEVFDVLMAPLARDAEAAHEKAKPAPRAGRRATRTTPEA